MCFMVSAHGPHVGFGPSGWLHRVRGKNHLPSVSSLNDVAVGGVSGIIVPAIHLSQRQCFTVLDATPLPLAWRGAVIRCQQLLDAGAVPVRVPARKTATAPVESPCDDLN